MSAPQSILTPKISPNPETQAVIEFLLELGFPPLPIASPQDANEYPLIKKGEIVRDKNGKPKPAFTGKNPSRLDKSGKPVLLNHSKYQETLPTDAELREWFQDPDVGIGTLGGFNNTIWIDFDVKDFDSQEDCDQQVKEWLEKYPQLKETWIERTHSGGYRFAVECEEKPDHTNIALEPGGKHRGEALGEGRFTVLAPTIGASGNAYKCINLAKPVRVKSLKSIGIYSTKKPKEQKLSALPAVNRPAVTDCGSIKLEDLLSKQSNEILKGNNPQADRSSAIVLLARDAYGWVNWCNENGIPVSGTVEELALDAGEKLDLDDARIGRILKSIQDSDTCQPSAFHKGGDKSCWLKILKLNKTLFNKACPQDIKDDIRSFSAKGFQVLEGGSASEQSNRDRFIQKRLTRFMSYWDDLQKDFTLSQSKKRQIEYYEGYAPKFELTARTICVRGWLGAGKTQATLESLIPYQNKVIIWVTGRNGLLRQTGERAERLGFPVYHYQDDPAKYRSFLERGVPGIYTMCPDSLKGYAVEKVNWKNAILVIDEFSGCRRSVLNNSEIMPEFERLLTEAETVIAVDAFLSDVDLRLLRLYRGSKNTRIYDQKASKSNKTIHWLECRNKKGEISMSQDGVFYPLLAEWIKEGKSVAVATDSKLTAKAVKAWVDELGGNAVICSSETVESNKLLLADPDGYLQKLTEPQNEQGQLLLSDPDEYLKQQATVLIYTPTAQSGLDVQTKFDKGLALCNGIISPIDFMQTIGRCRQCDEWYVSAPRRSIDPDCQTPSLESKKVREWGDELAKTFNELEVNQSEKTRGWGLWQGLTRDVEKSFASEYLHSLLKEFFETVTVVDNCPTVKGKWDQAVKAIKEEEAKKVLSANLENGQKLVSEKKAPSKDSEVWDVILAQEQAKYPKLWENWTEDFKKSESQELVDLARLFLSNRLKKLKYQVSVTGKKAVEDIEWLEKQIKKRFTSYNSERFRTFRNMVLFQTLKLEKLVKICDLNSNNKHETHFRYNSPIIRGLWNQFQQDKKLSKLFPTVSELWDFWNVIKGCMRFFAYQAESKSFRVETDQRNKNGVGKTSSTKSIHFLGWIITGLSGSQLFQANWLEGIGIKQAIEERLEAERAKRKTEAIETPQGIQEAA